MSPHHARWSAGRCAGQAGRSERSRFPPKHRGIRYQSGRPVAAPHVRRIDVVRADRRRRHRWKRAAVDGGRSLRLATDTPSRVPRCLRGQQRDRHRRRRCRCAGDPQRKAPRSSVGDARRHSGNRSPRGPRRHHPRADRRPDWTLNHGSAEAVRWLALCRTAGPRRCQGASPDANASSASA
jgi:hypothetical protein